MPVTLGRVLRGCICLASWVVWTFGLLQSLEGEQKPTRIFATGLVAILQIGQVIGLCVRAQYGTQCTLVLMSGALAVTIIAILLAMLEEEMQRMTLTVMGAILHMMVVLWEWAGDGDQDTTPVRVIEAARQSRASTPPILERRRSLTPAVSDSRVVEDRRRRVSIESEAGTLPRWPSEPIVHGKSNINVLRGHLPSWAPPRKRVSPAETDTVPSIYSSSTEG